MKFKKVKGTYDALDLSSFNGIKKVFQEYLERNAFSQIETPILEYRALFDKAVGQESDVALKEMFTIANAEKDNSQTICLRPEFTTSFVRAYIEAGIGQKNCRQYAYGPVFRHERPQKGRFRQFNQLNIEIINCKDEFYDLQLLELLYRIFQMEFKLSQFTLEVNYLGTRETQATYNAYLKEFCAKLTELCQFCVVKAEKNALKIFDCKNQTCQDEISKAKPLFEFLDVQSQQKFLHMIQMLALLGVNAVRSDKLVRGLDYYHGLVFEFQSSLLGSQSTFCAGGRYDLSFVFDHHEPLPSFGAGLGVERLSMILEASGFVFENKNKPIAVIIPEPDNQACASLALVASASLSNGKITHEVAWGCKKFGKGLEFANKLEASFAVIIGSQELESNFLTVKNMTSGEQTKVGQAELAEFLLQKK